MTQSGGGGGGEAENTFAFFKNVGEGLFAFSHQL